MSGAGARLAGGRAALAGLTTRGRCLFCAGVALAVCSLALGQGDLLRIAIFLLTLPLAAVVVVSRTRHRLTCTRSLDPDRIEAGQVTTVRLHLHNVSRLPSGVLLMEDELPYTLGGRPRFVLDVELHGEREVSYPVRTELRGRHRIGPLSVRLADPFGLCELRRSFAAVDQLTVTPRVTRLPAVRLGGHWTGGGEVAARSVSSGGSDDAATREYRHGDDLRRVHWRSTARVGELMVRREEQPFQSRATVLLDGRAAAHRGAGPASSFEAAVSAVASIGVALARSGFVLSVLRENGDPLIPPGVPPTESMVLDTLATVGTADDDGGLDGVVERLRRGGWGGVLVGVLGTLDLSQAQRLARLRTGTSVCVAVALDTGSWAPGGARDRAASVERAERVHALLTGAGWRVLPLSHGSELAALWSSAGGRVGRTAPQDGYAGSLPTGAAGR